MDKEMLLDKTDWTQEHKDIIYMVCKKTGLTEHKAYVRLMQCGGNYKEIIRSEEERKLVDVVERQTTYTRDEAFAELVLTNGDAQMVINKYLGNNKSLEPTRAKTQTTNQMIFSEIRGFMDNVQQGYETRKEQGEHLKKAHELCQDAIKAS